MQPRTKRQKDVLDYIKLYIEKHGYEPSYQQIANRLNVSSKAGIAKHIEALEKQGLITRVRENGMFKLALNSTMSASESVCEIEWLDVPRDIADIVEWEQEPLFVPKFFLGNNSPETLRAYRVTDDSMSGEDVFEDEVAFVKIMSYPRDGEMVVALIEDEKAILSKYFRDGANIELRPANNDFESQTLAADKIEIMGVFRGLLRPL